MLYYNTITFKVYYVSQKYIFKILCHSHNIPIKTSAGKLHYDCHTHLVKYLKELK